MKVCVGCKSAPQREGQRYCGDCHNTYMRTHRTPYAGLSEEQKRRNRARAYLNVYVQRGKVIRPEACESCGTIGPVRARHHRGYDNPLDVVWLCSRCHRLSR